MWEVKELYPVSGVWKTVALATSEELAEKWIKSREKWRQKALSVRFVEDIEFIG